MALKEAYMQHRVSLEADGSVELKPDEDESYLIKSVQCEYMNKAAHFLELKTGRTTVAYIMSEYDETNHIPYDLTNTRGNNIIEQLRAKGVIVDYPVATGEAFTIKNVVAQKTVIIVYQVYDAGERKKNEVNGSESKEYYQLNYGYKPVDEIQGGEYNLLDTSMLPKEMVNFPFGQVVPANTEVDIIGLFGIPSYFGVGGSNAVYTQAIKLIRERTTLFTKQPDCFAFEPITENKTPPEFSYKNSQIGFGSDTGKQDVFYPPKPITFYAGEELGIYLKVSPQASGGGANPQLKKIRVGVIERIRRV